MSVAGRPPAAALGKTRTCPHCKATVLESANVCPGCRHHLRFDPGAALRDESAFTAWKVEGVIAPRGAVEGCEYSVVIALRNDEGRELARHVVAVGALQPSERRAFTLSVDVSGPRTLAAPPPRAESPPPSRGTASPPNRLPLTPPVPGQRLNAPPPPPLPQRASVASAPLGSAPPASAPLGSAARPAAPRFTVPGRASSPAPTPAPSPPKSSRDPSSGG